MKLLTLAALAGTALAWSPTNSYAPGFVQCPDDSTFVRSAHSLSRKESDYISDRYEKVTRDAIKDFLKSADLKDFDVDGFVSNASRELHFGAAFSGGGYRAMLAGAGELSALDSRTPGATDHGLGGFLQASSYLAGLSGGSWLVGSVVLNNWTTIPEMVGDSEVWDLSHSILNPGGINVVETGLYYRTLSEQVDEKRDAGFNVSITDAWGRGLSSQFFPTLPEDGAAYTWSTIPETEPFQKREIPFPVVVAVGRYPHTTIVNLNSTVFEFNPYELGSWDPSLYAFTNVEYVGTNVSDGAPLNDSACVRGFDNAGFVLGTSSSLFSGALMRLNETDDDSSLVMEAAQSFLSDLSQDENDIAVYGPNPFADVNTELSSIGNSSILALVDGGLDLQNVPLVPLIQPVRQVDMIMAFDNSADTDYSWPNGSSLAATYSRQFGPQGNGTAFPAVPGADTFLADGLTARPTFFGCYASNFTDLAQDSVPPLIVYMANRPFSFSSNTSTYKMKYDTKEVVGMVQNGFEVTSRKNLTIDDEWKACVACAMVQREFERTGRQQTDQCKQCFDRYCWDGETVDYSVNATSVEWTDGGASFLATNGQNTTDSNDGDSSNGDTGSGGSSGSGSSGDQPVSTEGDGSNGAGSVSVSPSLALAAAIVAGVALW